MSNYSSKDVLKLYLNLTPLHGDVNFEQTIGKLFYIAIRENCTKSNQESLELINENEDILLGFRQSLLNIYKASFSYELETVTYYTDYFFSQVDDQIMKFTQFIDLCKIAGFNNIYHQCNITLLEFKSFYNREKDRSLSELNSDELNYLF